MSVQEQRDGFVIASQTPELILGKFKVNVMHERELFLAAYDIDNESMRRAYLDSACVGDAALRARVDRLLSREAAAGNFLEQPLRLNGPDNDDPCHQERADHDARLQPTPYQDSLVAESALSQFCGIAGAASCPSKASARSSSEGVLICSCTRRARIRCKTILTRRCLCLMPTCWNETGGYLNSLDDTASLLPGCWREVTRGTSRKLSRRI